MRKVYSENEKGVFERLRGVGICWVGAAGWVAFACRLLPPLEFPQIHDQTVAEGGKGGSFRVRPVADIVLNANAIACRKKQTSISFSNVSCPPVPASCDKD